MPKIVNHDQRKEYIAEAAWRVIRREGLDGVSVRNVADEAGVSLGSLRHYFETQSDLLAFSMKLVSSRVNRRIANLESSGDPRIDMERIIAETLPLDEARRAEGEVWLAFAGKAIADPAIGALSRDVHEELYAGLGGMIGTLIRLGLLPESTDSDYETKRLHALVDGLVVHHLTFPERVTVEDMRRVVSRHLDSLIIRPESG
ncbi:TetR/AcrR family transcriptional regulator [Paenibacillus hodogayensis]|uniref:TetR/AcrR family transcriptional regulator n=1 Tax=Paenibacillus hodogayensis TaxID=279208 RepID=A0ABV5VTX5_9BACL